jgi:hypothetical protein
VKIDIRSHNFVVRVEPAAEYICVKLHPPKLRSKYVEHIRVSYKADLIVYVLQELSTGMTALFLGLLTNYLYDKYKKKPRNKRREDDKLKKLIATQNRTIKALQRLLNKEKDRRISRVAAQSLAFHKKTLMQIKNGDRSIDVLVKESIEVLESKGSDALSNEIDSHWDDC